MKSKCCNKEMRVEGDTTKYYSCRGCLKACDAVVLTGSANTTTNEISLCTKCMSMTKNVCGKCKVDTNMLSYTQEEVSEDVGQLVEEFNIFIEKWTANNFPHLSDSDDNDGEDFRNKIKQAIITAHKSGAEEYRQFILNVLDGIDEADGQCTTKAIRLTIKSRII